LGGRFSTNQPNNSKVEEIAVVQKNDVAGVMPLDEQAQLALKMQREGRFVEAAQSYIAILRADPNHWPSYYNLGLAFQSLGRSEDAIIAYERAIGLKPDLAYAHNNLGLLLQAQGQTDAAARAYERALEFNPELAQSRYNLALIQQSRGRFTNSTESLRLAVQSNPRDDVAWDALYRTLLGLRRPEEAEQVFFDWERSVTLSPLLVAAGLAQSRYLGDRVREERYLQAAVEWPFATATAEEMLPIVGMLQYFDVGAPALLQAYQRLNNAVMAGVAGPLPQLTKRTAGDSLRIGYLSADFRKHVMGHTMFEVIRQHDKQRYQINLLSLIPEIEHDQLTAAFKGCADNFLDVSALSDFEAARAIAELDLDILVDLAGATMAGRPGIFAHRPARQIVTHLGYHGCLGVETVSYKFTDQIADTPESAQYQLERPFFLDGCLFPFTPIEPNPADLLKYANGRGADSFVFATFVNPLKLSPRCLDVWKRILDAAPRAVLAFSPVKGFEHQSLRRLMAAVGIPENRLRFIPHADSTEGQRARYAAVDAVLDTFPYAGGDTTIAALDRSVPVITLVGVRNAERVGASLLTHFGVKSTLCTSEEQYVACAVRMANDPVWFDERRAEFLSARLTSPWTASGHHTRLLEFAYTQIAASVEVSQGAYTAAGFFGALNTAVSMHRSATSRQDLEQVDQQYMALLSDQPNYVPILRLRASIAVVRRDFELARALLASAHECLPSDIDVADAFSNLLVDLGQLQRAEEVLSTTLTLAPRSARLRLTKARLLVRLEEPNLAMEETSSVLRDHPANSTALLIRATCLAELGQAAAALQAFDQVYALKPDAVAAYNAGFLAYEGKAYAKAESMLTKVIEHDPHHILAHLYLARSLKAGGKLAAWLTLTRKMSSVFAEEMGVRIAVAESHRSAGNLTRETVQLSAIANALAAEADSLLVESEAIKLLKRSASIDLPISMQQLLRHRYVQAILDMHAQRISLAAKPKPARARLRLGILTDLDSANSPRTSAVLKYAEAYIPYADVVFLYLLDGMSLSQETSIKTTFFPGASPLQIAKRIRDDAVDVLIDLCGYRHPSAPMVLAHHPASAVISNTAFGMPINDPRLVNFEAADEWTHIVHAEQKQSTCSILKLSSLLPNFSRLRDSVYERKVDSQSVPFTFGIPLGIDDLPQSGIQLVGEIAAACPSTRFAVHVRNDGEFRLFQEVFRFAPAVLPRLIATSPLDAKQSFDGIDLMLDIPLTNGGLVAQFALSRGCPVLSMRGSNISDRTTYAALSSFGLNELVCDSPRDYVQLAAKFVSSVEMRARVETLLTSAAPPNLAPHQPERDLIAFRAAIDAIEAERANH
jgi:protein O-GlcNAc transferase